MRKEGDPSQKEWQAILAQRQQGMSREIRSVDHENDDQEHSSRFKESQKVREVREELITTLEIGEQSDPELIEQLYFDKIFRRHDFNSLLVPSPRAKYIVPVDKDFQFRLNLGAGRENLAIQDELRYKMISDNIQNLITLFFQNAVLLTAQPVHIHDLCSGRGISSFFLAHLRKIYTFVQYRLPFSDTSITCWENKQSKEKGFDILKKIFDEDLSAEIKSKFRNGDIGSVDIPNIPERFNLWLAVFPDYMVVEIIEKLLQLSREQQPESVIIQPCVCHGYYKDMLPADWCEPFITEEERAQILEITDEDYDENNSAVYALVDCIRAAHINRNSDHLTAKVHQFKNSDTAIVIRKAG